MYVLYLQRWHGWCYMKLLPSRRVLCAPYNQQANRHEQRMFFFNNVFSIPSSKKADATVENGVHVFQAFSLPSQPKNEIVSQSVTVWKAGRALDLSAPRLEATACAAIYLKCFTEPNATHSSSTTFIYSTTEIANTTSLSAVVLLSSSAAWRSTRVSASSWVHPINQSVNILFYVCSHRHDIRPKK